MPDITKIISSGNYKNGSAVVSMTPAQTVANHVIDAKISQEKISSMTGVYDVRFDDPTYYSA